MPPGSKKEKRLARHADALAAFEKKKLRQLENPEAFKRIAEIEGVRPAKRVVEGQDPAVLPLMTWTRVHADVEGEWSWGPRSCLNDDWLDELEPFLIECARKSWNEIRSERTGGEGGRRPKHVFYDVEQICEEAQSRLILELEHDTDTVFRFRLGNLKRLYGIVQANVFSVLWWDPEHNIYPIEGD